MSTRASAATLETATKQNVGAAASKSQTYVGLNSGHHMPLMGWGTSGANGDECIQATKAAIEAGFRVCTGGAATRPNIFQMLIPLSLVLLQHIDTAEMYKNEEEIGKGLQELFKSGTVTREELFVTSKLWTEHHPRDQVKAGLTDSLKRLQLDYLDLYLIHWYGSFNMPYALSYLSPLLIPAKMVASLGKRSQVIHVHVSILHSKMALCWWSPTAGTGYMIQ